MVTGGVDKNDNTLQDAWILDVKCGRWREVSSDLLVTFIAQLIDFAEQTKLNVLLHSLYISNQFPSSPFLRMYSPAYGILLLH